MTERSWTGWVIGAGAGAVVVWRLLALRSPHPAFNDPALVRNSMAVIGLVFLGCGLWAYRRAPKPATALFALYALCAGMHWGGAVGIGSPRLQTVELLFYFVVSSTLGQALLLHLSFVFPGRWNGVTRPGILMLLYAPVAAGLLLMAHAGVIAASPESAAQNGVPLLALIGTLYGFGAVIIWAVRLATSPQDRQQGRLPLLLGAILLGALPNMVLSGMAPDSELVGLSNLFVVLIPAALAFVLTRHRLSGEPAARDAPIV